MKVQTWSYEDFPAFDEPVDGAQYLDTTGDEVGVHYMHDVVYARKNGLDLHLQILIPASRRDGFQPFADKQSMHLPCFVFVQGSGWMRQYVYADLMQLGRLAQRGFVCAIVEYRSSDMAFFPAQVIDAQDAVRFLRKNAERFGIDPLRMIIAGTSSGGHTAMWLPMVSAESQAYPDISSQVCGIVDFFGSTSVMAPDSNPQTVNHCLPDSPEGRVMGRQNLLEKPELARQLSVECQITQETALPPVLIFHGTKDRTVNCSGSAILYRTLIETGHDARLYILRGADHGGPEFWTENVLDIVEAFCRKCFDQA
ncbi:MAG: alpha/beta hydrolase [Clostridia bacterium]|nr:alpha/beta hydrolase [Clostridia bacterium]